MPNFRRIFSLTCILLLLTLAVGCSLNAGKQPSLKPDQNSVDPTCAYYYFMLGTRAEYDQDLDRALKMYQKAVACDPTADYINQKIPILLIRLGKLTEAQKWLQAYISKFPDKNAQRILLADINIHNGDIPEAIRLYLQAGQHDPKNQTILLRLGLLYSQQKDYLHAEKIFLSLLKTNEKSYFANLYLARIYNQTGEYGKATKRYKLALALNWSKELALEMGDFFSQQKQYAKALSFYRSVLAKNRKNEEASLGIIQTYLSMDHEQEAFAELRRLRTFTRHPAEIDIIESRIYINLGKPKKAQKILLTLLKKKPSDRARYLLAVTYFDQKHPEKALRTLKDIRPSSEEYDDSIFLQLRILHGKKHIDRALALLHEVVADKTTRKPVFYLLLGSLYQEIPEIAHGIEVLKEGIGHYPDDDQLYYELAILLEKSGKHDQAMAAMEKVLRLKPDQPEALNFIGYSWADANQHLNKALIYIKKAIAQKPNNGFIRDSLGWVYFRLGDFGRAVVELQKAVHLEPNDPHILEHLGDVYAAKGQKDKAIDTYTRAMNFFSTEQDKNLVRKKIKALEDS